MFRHYFQKHVENICLNFKIQNVVFWYLILVLHSRSIIYFVFIFYPYAISEKDLCKGGKAEAMIFDEAENPIKLSNKYAIIKYKIKTFFSYTMPYNFSKEMYEGIF